MTDCFRGLSTSSSPKEKLSVRYYHYPSGYKHYCKFGKDFRPELPDECPFCGSSGTKCLKHHGSYERVEMVSGYSSKYGSFLIYRFLCRTTGRTIQMIPDFAPARKRFLLQCVISVLEKYFLDGVSRYELYQSNDLHKSTLKRWLRGFARHDSTKRLCFLPYSTASPGADFCRQMLIFFKGTGNGDAALGAATGLLRLNKEFCCSLY